MNGEILTDTRGRVWQLVGVSGDTGARPTPEALAESELEVGDYLNVPLIPRNGVGLGNLQYRRIA